jgi:hypothetical protein
MLKIANGVRTAHGMYRALKFFAEETDRAKNALCPEKESTQKVSLHRMYRMRIDDRDVLYCPDQKCFYEPDNANPGSWKTTPIEEAYKTIMATNDKNLQDSFMKLPDFSKLHKKIMQNVRPIFNADGTIKLDLYVERKEPK